MNPVGNVAPEVKKRNKDSKFHLDEDVWQSNIKISVRATCFSGEHIFISQKLLNVRHGVVKVKRSRAFQFPAMVISPKVDPGDGNKDPHVRWFLFPIEMVLSYTVY